jgi:hypothetical protein
MLRAVRRGMSGYCVRLQRDESGPVLFWANSELVSLYELRN